MAHDPGVQVYEAVERVRLAPDAPRLAVCFPSRDGRVPIEFMFSFLQMVAPLNVRTTYGVRKNMLPAAARNAILEEVLAAGIRYAIFFDDDVIFPDMLGLRMWTQMQLHPEAALISGVYCTKIDPPEPYLYADDFDGAFWDWPLGALVPIHSAGAGVFIVDLDYVRKLRPPWFNDVIRDSYDDSDGARKKNIWGHDRYFMLRLRNEAGGVIYADTGLLCAHFDARTGRNYVVPPEAPCFQRPPLGHAFVPMLNDEAQIVWRLVLPPVNGTTFRGYLDWLRTLGDPEARPPRLALLAEETSVPVP